MTLRAAKTVRAARVAMRAASNPAVASAIAYAAADMLAATATTWKARRGGPLSDAADWFDRAAHDLNGRHRPAACRKRDSSRRWPG